MHKLIASTENAVKDVSVVVHVIYGIIVREDDHPRSEVLNSNIVGSIITVNLYKSTLIV